MIYSAHWDHLGIGPAVNGDTIYNGAKDNAVGVGGLLEIARAFTQAADVAEAIHRLSGGHRRGAGAARVGVLHRSAPIYPLARTAANINIDGLNVNGRTSDITFDRLRRVRSRRLRS